jgi:tetratricopeptide (TPR) repeat protein
MRFTPWLFLVVAVFGQPSDPQAQPFIELRFQSARLAEERSDFRQAEQDYQQILERYPKAIPQVYQNLGLVYYVQRKYSEAAATLESGLKLNPEMLGARLFLGASYLYLGQPEMALPHLESAHRRKRSLESSTYLGLATVALRKYQVAVAHFRRALDLAQDKADYLFLVGDAYLNLSEQVANKLSAAHPGSEYDQFITARILDGQEFYQVAARHYLLSARKDPWNASVFFFMARALAIVGIEEPSRIALERYRSLMPNDHQAKLDLAALPRKDMAEVGMKIDFTSDLRALPAVQDTARPPLALLPSSANDYLRRRIKVDQDWRKIADRLSRGQWDLAIASLNKTSAAGCDWLCTYLKAMVYFWKDDYERTEQIVGMRSVAESSQPAVQLLRWQVFHQLSLNYFQRLLDEYPSSSRTHFVKARILHGQGKKEALDEYQAAIAAGPQELGIRTALADYLLSNSKYQEALEACQGELALNPHSTEAKSILGRIYTQLRQPDQALPHLEAVLAADPHHAEARFDYARCYELKGDLAKALSEYQRALQDDPSLNRLHYVLARLYRRLGKPDLAEREFDLFQKNEEAERLRGRRLREQQLDQ